MRLKVKKLWLALGVMVILVGCTTTEPNSIPVVDASSPLSNKPSVQEANTTPTSSPSDAEAVAVAVPQASAEPIQAMPQNDNTQPVTTGIPLSANDKGGTPLDGAVLALLTTAEQQQQAGNLNEAAASIERAQRIAPGEPKVLYSLAVIRLKQGDAAAAEQVARRALSYTSEDQLELRSSLWEVIAQAKEQQGDQAGADQARQQQKARA